MEALLGLNNGAGKTSPEESVARPSSQHLSCSPQTINVVRGDESLSEESNELTSAGSFRTALRYNPLTLHSGMFLADVANRSSSDNSIESDQCSYSRGDASSQRDLLSSTLLPFHLGDSEAGDSEHYVFEDDFSSFDPRPRPGPRKGAISLSSKGFSAKDWEEHDLKQGRKFARRLLRPHVSSSQPGCDGDTASMTVSDDELPLAKSKKGVSKTSLLGRVLERKKVFAKSPSPLDGKYEEVARAAYRISELAASAIAESPLYPTPPGTVLARNSLADFGAWEKVLTAKEHTRVSSMETTGNDPENSNDVKELLSRTPPNSPLRTIPIRTISILRFSQVFSPTEEDSLASDQDEFSHLDLADMLEEKRSSAEDVASLLDIETEGLVLLDQMRARAGIIEDLSDKQCPPGYIPWLHLFDDFWMPHYEEYVVRAVHTYSRHLIKKREIKFRQNSS